MIVISNPYKGKIVLDSIAQMQQLISQGSLVIEGQVITYDPYHYDYWVKESNYYKKSEVDGMVQIIREDHAPTIGSVGNLGQCYIDVTNNKIYQCVDRTWDENDSRYIYTWLEIINNDTVPLHCATNQDIDNLFM